MFLRKSTTTYLKKKEFFEQLMESDVSEIRYQLFFALKKSILYNLVMEYNTSFWDWGKQPIDPIIKLLSKLKKNYDYIYGKSEKLDSLTKAKICLLIAETKANAYSRMVGDESEETFKFDIVNKIESDWKKSDEKKYYDDLKKEVSKNGVE